MKIAILGASGCIGTAITQHLLDTTQHTLTLFSHHAQQLTFKPEEELRLTHVDGDVLNISNLKEAVTGCDAVIYLIHLMGNTMVGRNFEYAEEQAARNVVTILQKSNCNRVIYIGGAGDEHDAPTRHLLSRHQTGEILRTELPHVIEFRTPMVIGHGAAGFEVIRNFVKWLPIVPVPSWGNATTQPITVSDVVRYIEAALNVDVMAENYVIDIGGPEVLSYSQIFRRYAAYQYPATKIIVTPFISKTLVRYVFRLFKNNPSMITAADMIESSQHSYAVRSRTPTFVQHITPEPIENGFY